MALSEDSNNKELQSGNVEKKSPEKSSNNDEQTNLIKNFVKSVQKIPKEFKESDSTEIKNKYYDACKKATGDYKKMFAHSEKIKVNKNDKTQLDSSSKKLKQSLLFLKKLEK